MNLIFIIHNHQPVGNFDYVIEDAYKKAYLPFVNEALDANHFRFGIHFSGYLLQYIEKNHPEYIEKLRFLIQKNRCEILSGGMYEPILTLLPERDRNEQIKRMNEYIGKLFKTQPKGFWVAERVWEQHLTKTLSQNGIQYIALDDTHFKKEGKTDKDLSRHFITEDEGETLNIFPISKNLRYLIPFKPVEQIIKYFEEAEKKDKNRLELFGDDGEKFGVWPKTYSYVYEKKWLKKFLKALKDNSSWLTIHLPSEYIANNLPKELIYLRECSYEEMMGWSEGNFRKFLIKYPESNDMNKKALFLSKRVKGKFPEELLKGETNDALWHGVFGGLYLPHLRIAIYENLIKAEKKIDPLSFKIEENDINKDGEKEFILETPKLNLYFTKKGGALYELDDKIKELNILNVLTRREEPYHKKILELNKIKNKDQEEINTIHHVLATKESNLDKFLIYDWYRRNSFIDHFFRADTTSESIHKMQFGEQGDFVLGKYNGKTKKTDNSLSLSLKRDGHVWCGENWEEVSLKKEIIVPKEKREIQARYEIHTSKELPLFFGIEFNFMFFKDGLKINKQDYKNRMKLQGEEFEIEEFIQKINLSISFTEKVQLWTFPIYTVSQSESGLERTFQGLSFIFSKKDIIKEKIININLQIK